MFRGKSMTKLAVTMDQIEALPARLQPLLESREIFGFTKIIDALGDLDMRQQMTPPMIATIAQQFIAENAISHTLDLHGIVSRDIRLCGSVTPEMIGQLAQQSLDDGFVYNFARLYEALKDDAVYRSAITPDMVGRAARQYLDLEHPVSFGVLFQTAKDDPAYCAAFTPDMISDAANLCLSEQHNRTFEMLYDYAKRDAATSAALGEFISIPASLTTHTYTINIWLRENRTKFIIGCLHKDSLFDLKQHWDNHHDDQRREQAWPTVADTFHYLAEGRNPPWDGVIVGGDRQKIVRYATAALRSLNP